MAEILLTRRKTPSNQSIKASMEGIQFVQMKGHIYFQILK